MKDKKINKSNEFSKGREFVVILEKIYTEIKIISEGQAALRDKVDSTMGMVAKNTEDIAMLNLSMSGVKSELASVKVDFTKINGKLAKIEEDIKIIKSDFGKRLTQLEALK